ncbi:MAG: ATPase [Flavobacteriales bacterium]|nr:ATPase [Flavobacteriales bacterium]|tara:strand:- start:979 stop:2139 length:1161 start_codon:yes stop_codon:yes gene_type:complete
MIQRWKLKDLSDNLNYFPVIGIVGPRQVGKTTISKTLIKELQKETLYLDLEDPQDQAKITNPNLFFERNQDKCIILDEVQRAPDLFPVLRSMIDKNRVPGRFILLGSASPELIRDSSESLAGRIAYEELTPFNLLEIINTKSIIEHWIYGGFPDSILSPNKKVQQTWMRNFIQTYIERDLPMLGLSADRGTIRKLWTMIAHMHGSLLNMSNLAKSLELTSPTIKSYLSFLEEAFLIRQLPTYTTNLKKRLVKAPKVYVRDSGILHFLLGINSIDELEGMPIIGNSWEGYAIEQICHITQNEFEPHFYRTHEGAEIDLVLLKAGKPIYAIEIKYTSAPKLSRGNTQAFRDINAKENFIITPNSDDYYLTKEIRVCSLGDFLKLLIAE